MQTRRASDQSVEKTMKAAYRE